MSEIRHLLKQNTLTLAAGEIWSKAMLFVITILIARSLGDTVFGQYTFIVAYTQLFLMILDFGLPLIAIRDMSHDLKKMRSYLNTIFTLKIALSVFTIILIVSVTSFLNKPPLIKTLIYVETIFIAAYSFNELLRSVFRAHEKFIYESITKIAESIVLLVFILIALSAQSLVLVIVSFAASSLLGFLITGALVYARFTPIRLSFNFPLVKKIIYSAWPLALANIFVIIYFRIDAVMLSFIRGDAVTGWYNAAYQLMYAFIFIPGFIMMSFHPYLSRLAKISLSRTKKLYVRLLFLMGAGGFLLLGLVFFTASPLIRIAYGPSFSPSRPALQILAVAVFFSFLSHVLLFTLTALNKQSIYTWAVGLGMVLNIALNLALIPRYSLYGAAWATVITELFTGLMLFIACQKLLSASSLTRFFPVYHDGKN